MTMDRDIELVLDHWFVDGPTEVADRVVADALLTIDRTPQVRPAMLRPRRLTMNQFLRFAAAPVAAVVVVALAVSYFARPSVPPVTSSPSIPTPSPTASAGSSADPSGPASVAPSIVFLRLDIAPSEPVPPAPPDPPTSMVNRIWTVRPDGRELRVVNPTLNVHAGYLGATRDGTAAVVPQDARLVWVDLATGAVSPLETGCTNPCMYEEYPGVSPDGSAVAFVRHSTLDPDRTRLVITILDLRTQSTAELQETTVDEPAELCVDVTAACSIVGLMDPAISPDGRRIAYTRIREIPGGSPDTLATVPFGEIVVGDIDGSSLRVLDLGGLPAGQPTWSPDGSRLLVSSNVQDLIIGPGGGPMTQPRIRRDVFSMAADGSDLRRSRRTGSRPGRAGPMTVASGSSGSRPTSSTTRPAPTSG